MLTFLNGGRHKYLLLLPILFLVLNSLYYRYVIEEIKVALLNEKYIEIVNAVNMLEAAIEANPERQWLDHEANLRDSVEFLDKLYQIYAGAYKYVGNQLELVTERFYETSPLEPLDYIEFIETVTTHESGSLVIGYAPEQQPYMEFNLYFKWMPLYSPINERFLVVAGVTSYSIVSNISVWVSVGQWVSTAITFTLNVWLILLLTRIGNVYDKRSGEMVGRKEGDSK